MRLPYEIGYIMSASRAATSPCIESRKSQVVGSKFNAKLKCGHQIRFIYWSSFLILLSLVGWGVKIANAQENEKANVLDFAIRVLGLRVLT